MPAAALRAAADSGLRAAEQGRSGAYYERLVAVQGELRAAYERVLGAADPADVAVTSCTSEGIARVLAALELGPDDEVLTADDEHPGLLGPLAQLRRTRGVTVRTAPLAALHEHVCSGTTLVACSHVSWSTGELAPSQLAGLDVPVLLDGAQGAGAVAVDVQGLGCAFYAASGQKWLCGPVGTGLLWIAPAWRERLRPAGPTYPHLAVPADGLDAEPWPDARAFDAYAMSAETMGAALGALQTLETFGLDAVHERAASLAEALADRLRAAGREVVPRDRTTLVSWVERDPIATVERLDAAGVVVRSLPGMPYVRAAVGAWNDESDLDRLVAALA